jgi:signal transduction histidine kinase
LVNQNFRLLHDAAQQKKIRLINEVPPGVSVWADRNQVDLVIRNILSNAIKFTNTDGTIRVSSKEENRDVVIAVADNGVGMEPEQYTMLFKNISNSSSFGTMGEKGTGLGLLLCREFVEKNNGSIDVESEPGAGSIFYIRLPKAG